MTSIAVDQLVRENAILIKENSARFFEEKGNLQTALKYMDEDNGVWKFKSTVPTANAMNMKNRLGMDNSRMKRIASSVIRKENRITKDDHTRKWLVVGITTVAIGAGAWWFFFRRKRSTNLPPFEASQKHSPSVFEAIMKKPKRRPKKVIKKMVVEQFDDMDISDDEEGLEYEGEEA